MQKRSRTVLFIVCIFLFLLAAPTALLYFQGYRFDFEKNKIVQTGGFYFKVLPASCQVYLDGDFKKKTSGFTGSVLIENLMPREYQVEIKKAGYHSWQKNLEVKEKQVTEAKHIILFPRNPKFEITENRIIIPKMKSVATSSDKTKVAKKNNYEIWISYPEKEEEIFLTRFSKEIGNIFWLTDHYLIFSVGDKIKISEIDKRDKINMVNLAEFKNPEIFWDKEEKNLYVESEGKIYLSTNLIK